VWRRAIESLGTVATLKEWSIVLALHYSHTVSTCLCYLPRVVEPLGIVATHCERAAGLHCAGVVLQSAYPHILLVFNGSPAARLVDTWCRPCLLEPWKILVDLDGNHDGRVTRGYLFSLMAHRP
jgi:hypothetical protein